MASATPVPMARAQRRPPTILIEDHAMKPLALSLLLTSAALLPLH